MLYLCSKKTKALISCAETVQLICTFIFAYEKNSLSQDLVNYERPIDLESQGLNIVESAQGVKHNLDFRSIFLLVVYNHYFFPIVTSTYDA